MVTVTCTDADCVLGNEDRNVLGQPLFVECGGCGANLEPRDHRDDPDLPDPTQPDFDA
jgi:hypothetical protein